MDGGESHIKAKALGKLVTPIASARGSCFAKMDLSKRTVPLGEKFRVTVRHQLSFFKSSGSFAKMKQMKLEDLKRKSPAELACS